MNSVSSFGWLFSFCLFLCLFICLRVASTASVHTSMFMSVIYDFYDYDYDYEYVMIMVSYLFIFYILYFMFSIFDEPVRELFWYVSCHILYFMDYAFEGMDMPYSR